MMKKANSNPLGHLTPEEAQNIKDILLRMPQGVIDALTPNTKAFIENLRGEEKEKLKQYPLTPDQAFPPIQRIEITPEKQRLLDMIDSLPDGEPEDNRKYFWRWKTQYEINDSKVNGVYGIEFPSHLQGQQVAKIYWDQIESFQYPIALNTSSAANTRDIISIELHPYMIIKEYIGQSPIDGKEPHYPQFRFKTESEFITAYGTDWRDNIRFGWDTDGDMDYLYGRILTPKEYQELKLNQEVEIENFTISLEMITEELPF